jgi:tetratricopeptide (TPR) repeat protein
VCTALGDTGRAAQVYELLLPFGDANVVIGLGAVCLGATSRYLGRLALTMGRRADALEHLRQAIEANTALGAAVHLAHTQLDYANALGPGAQARRLIEEARQTAAELDLPAVTLRAAKAAR